MDNESYQQLSPAFRFAFGISFCTDLWYKNVQICTKIKGQIDIDKECFRQMWGWIHMSPAPNYV